SSARPRRTGAVASAAWLGAAWTRLNASMAVLARVRTRSRGCSFMQFLHRGAMPQPRRIAPGTVIRNGESGKAKPRPDTIFPLPECGLAAKGRMVVLGDL